MMPYVHGTFINILLSSYYLSVNKPIHIKAMLKKSTLFSAFLIAEILVSYSPLTALAAPANLIKNPSAEIGTALPDFWSKGNWGTNTAAFTYPAPGIDGAQAMRVDVSDITSGDAKWYFEDVAVKPDTAYVFSDSYQSNVDTEAVIRYKTTGGATNYVSLGAIPASTAIAAKQFVFTTPTNAASLTVFHLIAKNGYLITDNYSLTENDITPPPPPPSSSNLIANGSFETAGTGGNPGNWTQGGWGANTPVFTYPSVGADGNKSAKVEITSYTSGDAKWYFADVPVTAGASYTFTDIYKSTAATELVIQYKIGTGFSYQFLSMLPVASGWTTATQNFTVPAGATAVSVFHLLRSVGTLETDEFSLVANTAPPDGSVPTANITSPTAGAMLSGAASVSVNAADNVAVAGVTLLVDGAVVGTEDTAAPYNFTFNTSAFSNTSHTLTARARDTSGNLGTSAGVTVIISNGPPVTPGFEAETIASGLVLPTAMAFAPDGRIFIAEKGGAVRAVKNGVLLLEPVIALTDVNTYNDRGLIGIAVDPNFTANGYLYLSYTFENTPGANFSGQKTVHIARVTVVGDTASESSKVLLVGTIDGNAAKPSCENFLVTDDCIPSDSPSHSAGGLRFGPDGKLYATLGEGANFDRVDTLALRAQNIDSLGGKVLRLNPDGTAPADNPFYNGDPNANRSKVYAYGVRNAFRFNFRPSDGALFLGDVGWDTWEEINLIRPGGNYGWPCFEGTSRSAPASGGPGYVCDAPGAVAPLYFYQHNSAFAGSVTAGAFPAGSAYPAEFSNSLFFGDYAQDLIKRLVLDSGNNVLSVQQDVIDNPGGPVDLSTGPDGNVYYLAIYTGELKRLVYTTGNRNPVAIINTSAVAGLAPLSVNFSSAGSSDPNGDALTYSWNFGDGTTSSLANPNHVYTANGAFLAVLTLSDGRGGVDIKSIMITVGNKPPEAFIGSPASGSLYKAGNTIAAQGSGTDSEDGALGASAHHWQIILHHNTHTHTLQEFFNTASPSFIAPDHSGETDVYTEIILTVTDSAGLTGTRSVNLYLDNGTSDTSGNLIKNPSMETADPNNGENPLYWTTSYYGNSNAVFTYPVPGFDGTKAATVNVSGYVSGGAKWYFDPVYVTPGQEYRFSDYYTGNSNSSLTAEFGFADGTYKYVDLATLPPAATPTRVESTITIPANVQRLSVTHELAGNGTLTTDNFSLTLGGTVPPPPPPPPTSSNLITNGSFETAGTGGNPLGWTRGGWGDQTAVFTYPIAGFDGGKAVELKITAYPATGGDSKWIFEDVSVTPGTLYTYSERYQANTISDVIGQYTMNDGSEHYFGLTKELPPTSGWTQNSGSFCPPVGTKSITLFHLLSTITTLSLDDVSLTAGGSCTPAETIPPTVAFTNPLEGNTVSGTVTLNASATDNVGVTQFFFAVDGDPFGPIMPTGPYTINWNSTGVANGPHTLKATATDAAGNNERQIINIVVNN
jgi:glucose/arabinose dehydrogenase